MAINKAMRAALKALSYTEFNVTTTYPMQRRMEAITSRLAIKPPVYKTWDRKIPCGNHNVPVRIFSLPDELPHPVLLFFHGGGWVTGNIDSYDRLCADMALLTGHVVVSVDYRLAPEHRFPAGAEDCYAVTRELLCGRGYLDVPPEAVTLIGDSAGGNLAAVVSLMARDRGEFLPARQILIYPATYNDHSEQSPYASVRENGTDYLLTSKRVGEYMSLYMSSKEDLRNPYFAPLLAEDLSGQPPTLIITAEYCPLRDEGEDYGRRLREAGSRVEIHRIADALHGYLSLPASFALVKQTYGIINRFLGEVNLP